MLLKQEIVGIKRHGKSELPRREERNSVELYGHERGSGSERGDINEEWGRRIQDAYLVLDFHVAI